MCFVLSPMFSTQFTGLKNEFEFEKVKEQDWQTTTFFSHLLLVTRDLFECFLIVKDTGILATAQEISPYNWTLNNDEIVMRLFDTEIQATQQQDQLALKEAG